MAYSAANRVCGFRQSRFVFQATFFVGHCAQQWLNKNKIIAFKVNKIIPSMNYNKRK